MSLWSPKAARIQQRTGRLNFRTASGPRLSYGTIVKLMCKITLPHPNGVISIWRTDLVARGSQSCGSQPCNNASTHVYSGAAGVQGVPHLWLERSLPYPTFRTKRARVTPDYCVSDEMNRPARNSQILKMNLMKSESHVSNFQCSFALRRRENDNITFCLELP